MSNLDHTSNITTIEEYLRGSVAYTISDEALAAILLDRGIESGSEVVDLTLKERELSKADLFMWCAGGPKTSASVEDVNGVWKHKEGAVYMSDSDRRYLIKLANRIYSKYGELQSESSIKVNVRGIRLCGRR